MVAAEVVFYPVAFFGAAAFTFDDFTDDFAVGAQVWLVLDFTIFAGLFLVEQAAAFAGIEVQLGAAFAGDLFDAFVFAVVPVFFTLAATGQGLGQVVAGPADGTVAASNQLAIGIIAIADDLAGGALQRGNGVRTHDTGPAGSGRYPCRLSVILPSSSFSHGRNVVGREP